jgi:comEA protein
VEHPGKTSAPEQLPLLERFKYPVFAVVAVAIVAGVAVLLWKRPAPTTITVLPPEPTLIPSSTPVPSVTPTPGPYLVYVTGAVVRPESIVSVPFGSRVLDAVQAAGGPGDDADLERVNLAQVLNDGDQVHVPTRAPGADQEEPALVLVVTSTPGTCTVYVTGEVNRPETLVSLPPGSRVEDAIQAAGGATDAADLARVNLGQILNDGDLVYIPPLTEEAIQTPTPNHPPLVHVNSATLEELETLPGIGPTLAQAIIDYRTQNGAFHSLVDLDNVPGLGPTKLEAIRDQIVFD